MSDNWRVRAARRPLARGTLSSASSSALGSGRPFRWGNWLLEKIWIPIPASRRLILWIISKKLKSKEPLPVALFMHYVEGTGQDYDLNSKVGDLPERWKDWIVHVTGGNPGTYCLVGEQSGIDDLSDSLGHFDVIVTKRSDSNSKICEITKQGGHEYQFGFKPNDKSHSGRHGFRFHLTKQEVRFIRDNYLLPSGKYRNPGGFDETFELVPAGGRWKIFIPWQVLVRSGKPFNVYGKFER